MQVVRNSPLGEGRGVCSRVLANTSLSLLRGGNQENNSKLPSRRGARGVFASVGEHLPLPPPRRESVNSAMPKLYKILFFCSILVLLFSAASSALALDFGSTEVGSAAEKAGYSAATDETTFAVTIGAVIAAALSFVGVIFLVLMVYAGYLWMTARGEEAQVEKSQKIIISSIIGLIITVGAYSITSFVVPRITDVTGEGQEEEPVCCQVCPKSGSSADCDYESTSAELCSNKCASGQLGPLGNVCDGIPMSEFSDIEGIWCSADTWPD